MSNSVISNLIKFCYSITIDNVSETLEKIIESLNITTEELFANDHIKTKEELIIQIQSLLSKAEKDIKLLEKTYRILKGLIEEI